jgi:hypothetical protein
MQAPTADELAAIAAAYAIMVQLAQPPCHVEPSRWRLAARLPDLELDAPDARVASRWSLAGRLDE